MASKHLDRRTRNQNCDPTRQPIKACRKCKLYPPTIAFRWETGKRRWSSWCDGCRVAAVTAYKRTEAGRAAQARYHRSEAGKAAKRAYQQSERGKAARAKRQATARAKLLECLRVYRYRLRKGIGDPATVQRHMGVLRAALDRQARAGS